MQAKLVLIAFILVCVIQFAVPFYLAVENESNLTSGKEVKIRCVPVDPYDIFRGRYISLRTRGFQYTDIPEHKRPLLIEGADFFALIGVDQNGFAYISDISLQKPAAGDYLILTYDYRGKVQEPFDRFYMNQEKAPAAEKAYFESLRNAKENTYIRVRIKDGRGTIEGLYLDDRSILDVVE